MKLTPDQKEKRRKKFTAIAKADTNTFVKYRYNDFNKFLVFILRKFPQTYYINIFSNKGSDKNKLLFTWGKHKGLQPAK